MSPKVIDVEVSDDQRLERAQPTAMELLVSALPKATPNELAQLLDVQLRYEAHEARKAYIDALHQFRQNAPVVLKTKKVSYQQVSYNHAELDKICEALVPELGKYGLSVGWQPEPAENGKIRVSCVLTHRAGHRQIEATIDGPPDTTGSKNSVQAIGSTHSYLERYTLLAALGIAPKNMDNDGRTSEGLPGQAIEDWLNSIAAASNSDELKHRYEKAKQAANAKSDAEAVKQFVEAKNKRYRELMG